MISFYKKKPSLVSKNLIKRLINNEQKNININEIPKREYKSNRLLTYIKKIFINIYEEYGSIIICIIIISWFLYYRYILNINLKNERKNKLELYNSIKSDIENFEDKSDMVYVTPNIDFINNSVNNNTVNIDDQVNILDDSDTDLFENEIDDENDNNIKINNDFENKNYFENRQFFESFANNNTISDNNPLPSNSNDPTFNYL
jgi:hypothetical protein